MWYTYSSFKICPPLARMLKKQNMCLTKWFHAFCLVERPSDASLWLTRNFLTWGYLFQVLRRYCLESKLNGPKFFIFSANRPCPDGWSRCRTNYVCVPDSVRCDGEDDCRDNSDEDPAYCPECSSTQWRCANGWYVLTSTYSKPHPYATSLP